MRFFLACIILLLFSVTTEAQPKAGLLSPLFITLSDGQNIRFEVEVAVSNENLSKGLMFRKKMPAGNGMLFDFGEARQVSMWMKNTLISLDMLFIASDGTIVNIAERTTPLSLESVSSQHPVRYVLEINAGSVARFGIKNGDKVIHSRIK